MVWIIIVELAFELHLRARSTFRLTPIVLGKTLVFSIFKFYVKSFLKIDPVDTEISLFFRAFFFSFYFEKFSKKSQREQGRREKWRRNEQNICGPRMKIISRGMS